MQSTAHACVLDVTLKEFEAHLYDEERAAATVKRYMHDAAHFLSFLSGRGTAKEDVIWDASLYESSNKENADLTHPHYTITKSDTIAYKDYLLGNYSVRSVNTMLSSISRYLDLCGAGDMKVRQVRVQNSHFQEEDRNLSLKDYRRLVIAARRKNIGLAVAMETLAMTGARVSELAFFTVSAVKNGRVTIQNKGKRRTILIPAELRRRLIHYAGGIGTTLFYVIGGILVIGAGLVLITRRRMNLQ